MSFRTSFPGSRASSAGLAGGLATLTRRFRTVAMRRDLVVDRPKIGVGVVVAAQHVVDGIGARAEADVADAPVVTQHALPLGMPRCRQSRRTIAISPLTGRHASSFWAPRLDMSRIRKPSVLDGQCLRGSRAVSPVPQPKCNDRTPELPTLDRVTGTSAT